MTTIDPERLVLFVCPAPACRASFAQEGESLVCRGCGRVYRVEDGCPVLILEEAGQRDERGD